jgi:L-threonylcarbamoyladenylate synthase
MFDRKDSAEISKTILPIISGGGVGVFPTDTLYGLVGRALEKETVERIFKLRKRDLKKPMIILISALADLDFFAIKLDGSQKKFLKKVWPGRVSVIFPCKAQKFSFLHRGKKTLAFRIPEDSDLRNLLKKTGPLVAPSANLAGEKPAETFGQARKYFGEKVDFYVDAGTLKSEPSTIIELAKDGDFKLIRSGAVKFD